LFFNNVEEVRHLARGGRGWREPGPAAEGRDVG
jgi:hypothetical protein